MCGLAVTRTAGCQSSTGVLVRRRGDEGQVVRLAHGRRPGSHGGQSMRERENHAEGR